jgi:predicted MPP superfamily phosphohydrolase
MRTLVHLSDTHILPTDADRLQGVDTLQNVRDILQVVEDSGLRPDALIVSGDLANSGEIDSYRRLRAELEPAIRRLESQLIVAIGNHDARPAFREAMLDAAPTDEPIDYMRWIGELRVIVLDSTVPGAAYGEVRPSQRQWLSEQLETRADEGTLLVLHHPPVPDATPLAGLLTLHGAADLENVIRGSDVVCVLAGHAHHAITAAFGGAVCYAAPATAYTIDPLLLERRTLRGVQGGGFGLIRHSTALLYAAEAAASGKYELRTAGEPSFGAQTVHPVNSGSGLFVFAMDPARQRAAWEFLNFAASQRGFTIITSMIGYVPQRDDVVDDPQYLKPFVDKDPNLLTAYKQLPGLEPWLNWSKAKQGVQAESLFVEALQNVVYGGQDAQSTMDMTANRVAGLLADG